MFELEKSIVDWRKQMLAAGIKSPVPLEELEVHLREEIERQSKSGLNEQKAFEFSVQRIGQAGILKAEFAKAGGMIPERFKQAAFTLTGIPNYQLATNMNTTNSNIEPRWATYLKTFAFLLPAASLWIFSMTFLFPKCQEILSVAKVNVPPIFLTAIALSKIVKNSFIYICIGSTILLVLLEWRGKKWPRYRRASFGAFSFLLNFVVLIWITAMVILSLIAAGSLENLAHRAQ